MSNNRIEEIYKSRNTMLKQLEEINYNVEDYDEFSRNEIDSMYKNNQLDLLVNHKTENKKVYIKYYISLKSVSKQIKPANLDDIIEDLYVIDNVLTKTDTLIIIIDDKPNDTIITKLKYLYEHDGIFIIIHQLSRLQFNILEHNFVPKMTILNEQEVENLKKEYNLKTTSLLPEIYRFDPQAMCILLRPGQIVKIYRQSPTSLVYDFYRICV
jgi:DNA-directed RNA polymerase subunit H (RpoH/RPB5)